MMKYLCKIFLLVLLAACSTEKLETPEGEPVSLQMATEGADIFENYISSLSIYAFRQTAANNYVYEETLADLDAEGIIALKDGSTRGDSKLFSARLTVGTYQLYFAGNGAGNILGSFQKGITTPKDITLQGSADGRTNVYFLGNLSVRVVANNVIPFRVTLNRAISRVIVVLTGVPSQIDTIRLSLQNIAQRVAIDGTLSSESVTLNKNFGLSNTDVYRKDTVVYELLALPSIGISQFNIVFRSVTGVEKTKEMPPLTLLPDKYIRVTGEVLDSPGALLSFDLGVNLILYDFFVEKTLPDFSLEPNN